MPSKDEIQKGRSGKRGLGFVPALMSEPPSSVKSSAFVRLPRDRFESILSLPSDIEAVFSIPGWPIGVKISRSHSYQYILLVPLPTRGTTADVT